MAKRFPDGARVCFLGDSITAHNKHVARIADYYEKNFPDSGIRFFNCGVSGGTLESLLTYFDDDTRRRRPTHAVIMLAVNDSGCWYLDELPRGAERTAALRARFEAYQNNLEAITRRLTGMGVAITLCTPVPYAEYEPNEGKGLPGCYALVAAYAEYVREFARAKNYPLCDIHRYITEEMQNHVLFGPDRTHPNDLGHYCMAKCFLAFQGLTIGGFEPLPERIMAWTDKVRRLRLVYEAEWNVIAHYDWPDEQKAAFVRDYIANEKWQGSHAPGAMEQWIRGWAENRPHLDELYDQTENY